MYYGVVPSVRIMGGEMTPFPFSICLYQGSALCSYLFALIMD